MLPSFSTLVSDIDRFHSPFVKPTSFALPSITSLLPAALVNTSTTTTIIQHQNQLFSHKRKIELVDTVSIHALPRISLQNQITNAPKAPSIPQPTIKLPCSFAAKKIEPSTKKPKLENKTTPKFISVGSLKGIISEVLEQASAGDPEEENEDSKETSKESCDAIGALFVKLRTQVYVQMLEYSQTSKQHLCSGEKRFYCPFMSNCKKTLKGLGNLRRHIEWHLTRLEDDVRYQAKYVTEKITTQKASSLVMLELERQEKHTEEC
mmetsp:Transcript_27394/g.38630  ORF Transcript_27394/g.38630 Transcript_27394/m.38630 type:complete len:264 (+) Transcript_27394:120-911(+)